MHTALSLTKLGYYYYPTNVNRDEFFTFFLTKSARAVYIRHTSQTDLHMYGAIVGI